MDLMYHTCISRNYVFATKNYCPKTPTYQKESGIIDFQNSYFFDVSYPYRKENQSPKGIGIDGEVEFTNAVV